MSFAARRPIIPLFFLVCSFTATAQVPVNGVADKTVYPDRVSLEVVSQPGYSYGI